MMEVLGWSWITESTRILMDRQETWYEKVGGRLRYMINRMKAQLSPDSY